MLYVSDLRQYEVPLSGSLGIQPYQSILSQLEEMEETKATALLSAAKSVFKDAGQEARIKTQHSTGFLVDKLRDCEEPYDLIMLGKRGEHFESAKEHIGSTIERVVRASSKPCLMTSRAYQPIERVALAFDGGESSNKALNYIISSNMFRGLEIHVVSVPDDKGEDFALQNLRNAEDQLVEITKTGALEKLVWAPKKDPDNEIKTIHNRTEDPHPSGC